MSWWSGSKKDEPSPPSETTFSSGDVDHMGSSGSVGVPSAGGGGMGELQQMSMMIQQQLIVQQVINDLTDRSYTTCITGKPSGAELSGSQVACVKSVVNKWLDTNEFMTGRLAKKSAANQHAM